MKILLPTCLLLLVVTPAVAQEAVAEGAHFRVALHFDANGLEKETLGQVEALWSRAADLYGLAKSPLRQRLQVHLYRDTVDYEVAEEKLTGGAFRRNLAFAHFDTQSAHVAMQPHVSDEALAVTGLPHLTRSLLLHEAAHLIRFHAMPNYRSHPDWLADGAAMWLKRRVLAAGANKDAEPLSSTDVVRVQRLLDAGRLPSVEAILADQVGALEFYSRYATRWLFFRYLEKKHGTQLKKVLREARRLAAGPALGRNITALLSKRLGQESFAALDDGFRRYVRSLAPEWEEVLRSLHGNEAKRVSIAFPDSNAVAWLVSPVGKLPYALEGTVEILPNTERQLNVLLDRSDKGFLCVALNADFGVTLFEYESAGSKWHRRGSVRHGALKPKRPFRVRVEVSKGRVDVAIDGKRLLGADFPDRRLDGAWGLGALAGSAGIWRDFGRR